MVSQWAGTRPAPSVALKRVTLRFQRDEDQSEDTTRSWKERRGGSVPIRPFSDGNFVWPTVEELQAAQQRHIVDRPKGLTQIRVGLLCSDDRIWIPSNEESLVQRLLVISHCEAQGHRGRDALINIVNRRFLIRNISVMVKTFLASCLMCQHVKGGKIVMIPWTVTLRCNKLNGALHWDYVQLGNSFGDSKYLLVLKDEATHFCELVPCAVPTAAVTAEAILDWYSRRLTSGQKFTVTYSPWINGSIERIDRGIVQVLRAMCLEAKVGIRDWVHFIPVLQSNLNHIPVPSLANKAPVELFCILPASSPLDFSKDKTFIELGTSTRQIESKLEQLRVRVQDMHKRVQKARKKQTRRNHKAQSGAKVANFDIGDYCGQMHNGKLLVTWVGLYHVVGADEHSFRVQHLVSGAESDVHASRLKFFADASFEVTEEIPEHVAAQGIITTVAELK
ncbi:Hypothetical protein PHPALM_3157 [Phytophthora palmivora]|uniref:Integrase catalytic domain-containing protein n=1 Tax=Phytophthora palmivora TaxID=4796 RepID=A0A2P4YN75_9STRA|nr:Hypothetical protein PHPALM_3157 [Phytophthora palmivora]